MITYHCFNRTKEYQGEVKRILEETRPNILNFFEVDPTTELSFQVYLYDTIEELRQGLLDRGFPKDPEHMCACQKDKDVSLNFFEPKDCPGENEWSKKEYEKVIFHEQIHVISYCLYGKQPEWLTEGVAKILDGTYSSGIAWLLENYINPCPVPPMKELEEEFGWHEYDSYDYAYLMVSYLIETLGKTKFLEVSAEPELLSSYSDALVTKAVTYYQNKYQVKQEANIPRMLKSK